ncbi:taste receptor type 2 member 125-like [Mus pahari]|uniref:taste receptor type 2 member 125-like n=1 Tax=Mus pahari TaxID=10093 RepID=UPI000A30E930|nr:taste receptor type 2 member 125-like [Mus pahari]
MGAAILVATATIVNVEFIIGNVGNGFIALANIMDWVKRRKLSSLDQLLTALAISRITLLWSLYLMKRTFLMDPNIDTIVQSTRLTNAIWIISNHFSIWLATILSIFYFLKIANFSNFIFYYLRWRFEKVILVALLVSLVLFFIDILVTNMHINIWADEFKGNVSDSYKLKIFFQVSRLLVLTNTMFTFVPFTVSMIMFFLLIFSLWKHLKMVKHIALSSQNASTTAHINALRNVVVFLLLYVIFILSLFAHLWSFEFEEKTYFAFFCLVGIFALPSLHSCILILGNSKLREISLLVLSLLKCKMQGCESLGPWHTREDTFAQFQ